MKFSRAGKFSAAHPGVAVGDDGIRALVESRHLTALRHLSYPTLGLSFRLRLALHERYDPT